MLNSDVEINEQLKNLPTRFYVDYGTGFNEDNVIIGAEINSTNTYYCAFKIPVGAQRLRFDPVELQGCFISQLSIMIDKVISDVQIVNGVIVEHDILFNNSDPQININTSGMAGKTIEVSAIIKRMI